MTGQAPRRQRRNVKRRTYTTPEALIPVEQVAFLWDMSVAKVRYMIRRGDVPAVRVGRRYCIHREHVPTSSDGSPLVDARRAGSRIRCSARAIRRHAAQGGIIGAVLIGSTWRFDAVKVADLSAFEPITWRPLPFHVQKSARTQQQATAPANPSNTQAGALV